MAKIYVVFGSTGEYSDRNEWLVDAWPTEELAKARVTELKNKYLELGGKRHMYQPTFERFQSAMQALDPKFRMDYTGTDYYYTDVELKG